MIAGASIRRLFGWRSPSAIFRSVVAINVFSVQSVRWRWARPHIGQEILKFQPSFGISNAPRTIVRNVKIATRPHTPPNSVFGRLGTAVRRASRNGRVALKATARPATLNNHMPFINGHGSAVAPDLKLSKSLAAPSLSFDFFDNGQSAKPITRVKDFCHA